MDLGLDGRVYLVTGGSRGLGRAGARALVAEGARVVLSARDADEVAAAAEDLGALGGPERAVGVVADNGEPDAPARLTDAARTAFGRLDGALLSVGGPPAGTALGARDEQWQAAFDTVFLGTLRIARAVAGGLGDGGAISFVLSSSVRTPIPGLAISNGLRPGLAMLAKTLADELGPRGVRVTGLLPGRIATDRTRALDGDDATRRRNSEAIPLRRYGEPDEFGRVAAFVLSPAASYLTGLVLPVDGGALRAV